MERIWMKIGEAAQRLGVKPKDLRYWERLIPELQPRRSEGNLRYYHVDELDRLLQIRNWLEEGLTVSDCRQLLRTGQLTRGLDLDLGLGEEPVARPRPLKKQATKVAKPRSLTRVAVALRKLVKQLSHPPLA